MGGDHQELEVVWRERWERAKTNLELAAIHFHEIERMANIHKADYERSLRVLTAAVAEYSEVLRIYTDLKVYGKTPDDFP